MVETTAEGWRALARSGQVKAGKALRRETPAGPVLLGRQRDGAAYALKDLCPHRGAALSAGKVRTEADGRQTIECPYHLWRFHTDGTCAAAPSLDAGVDLARIRARTYPVAEAGGQVWVWTSDAPPGVPPVDVTTRGFRWPWPWVGSTPDRGAPRT